MYDVIYVNGTRQARVLVAEVERESAVSTARTEARRRRVGRMFLAGSEPMDRGDMILIVESEHRAVAA